MSRFCQKVQRIRAWKIDRLPGLNQVDVVKQKNAERKVVVYTRSWCPYCTEVRRLPFQKLRTILESSNAIVRVQSRTLRPQFLILYEPKVASFLSAINGAYVSTLPACSLSHCIQSTQRAFSFEELALM